MSPETVSELLWIYRIRELRRFNHATGVKWLGWKSRNSELGQGSQPPSEDVDRAGASSALTQAADLWGESARARSSTILSDFDTVLRRFRRYKSTMQSYGSLDCEHQQFARIIKRTLKSKEELLKWRKRVVRRHQIVRSEGTGGCQTYAVSIPDLIEDLLASFNTISRKTFVTMKIGERMRTTGCSACRELMWSPVFSAFDRHWSRSTTNSFSLPHFFFLHSSFNKDFQSLASRRAAPLPIYQPQTSNISTMELAMSMVEYQTIQSAFRIPEEMAALPENILIKAHMYTLAYLLATNPIYKSNS